MGYGILPRVGTMGSFQERSREYSSGAIQARSAMRPGSRTETTGPKTEQGKRRSALNGKLPKKKRRFLASINPVRG